MSIVGFVVKRTFSSLGSRVERRGAGARHSRSSPKAVGAIPRDLRRRTLQIDFPAVRDATLMNLRSTET